MKKTVTIKVQKHTDEDGFTVWTVADDSGQFDPVDFSTGEDAKEECDHREALLIGLDPEISIKVRVS